MLVGNGAVGKTTVARVLDIFNNGGLPTTGVLKSIQKTNNMEYEFITTQQVIGNTHYSVTMQFLVPPGQKEGQGDPDGRGCGTPGAREELAAAGMASLRCEAPGSLQPGGSPGDLGPEGRGRGPRGGSRRAL